MASSSVTNSDVHKNPNSAPSSGQKRKHFSLTEKLEIIREIDSKKTYGQIAKEKGISRSTISTIYAQRVKIERSCMVEGMENAKKIRHGDFEDVDANVLTWFRQQRSRNIPICGPLMKAEALRIAKKLGRDNFEASTGWLDRFKVRHKIVFNTAAGESAAVDMAVVTDHLSIVANAVKSYSLRDVYNMDELALFYK
jgi:hypothetical protein